MFGGSIFQDYLSAEFSTGFLKNLLEQKGWCVGSQLWYGSWIHSYPLMKCLTICQKNNFSSVEKNTFMHENTIFHRLFLKKKRLSRTLYEGASNALLLTSIYTIEVLPKERRASLTFLQGKNGSARR